MEKRHCLRSGFRISAPHKPCFHFSQESHIASTEHQQLLLARQSSASLKTLRRQPCQPQPGGGNDASCALALFFATLIPFCVDEEFTPLHYFKIQRHVKQTVCHYLGAPVHCSCSPSVFIKGVVRIYNSHIINCFIKTAALCTLNV